MKATKWIVCLAVVFVSTFFAQPTTATAAAPTHEWTRQLGTNDYDYSQGVSADGLGNVYITGWTRGSLGGANAGQADAFLSKYDASGSLLWTEQLGTSNWDGSYGVSSDGLGNVYITGITQGNLGGPLTGVIDAFLSKYDSSGSLLWTEQLGASLITESNSVSSDSLGNVYISGTTVGKFGGLSGAQNAFLSKYDASGNLLWTEQPGISGENSSQSVSSDGLGNVYISGVIGSLEATTDAFLSKYDASGNLLWTEQLGTSSHDVSNGVSSDGLGNVYISCYTEGNLDGPNAGGKDAFLSKYDSSGSLLWTEQLGTSSVDESFHVSSDDLGNVYISGYTGGNLGGTNAGSIDAFLSKYDSGGNLHWTEQLGTYNEDASYGVSSDGLGSVYISGYTWASLGGPHVGIADAFIAKFSEPAPESGDFDADGDFDGTDFLRWQRGGSPNPLSATDLAAWQNAYGPANIGASESSTVPEPSTLLLSAMASVGMLLRRNG